MVMVLCWEFFLMNIFCFLDVMNLFEDVIFVMFFFGVEFVIDVIFGIIFGYLKIGNMI